MPKIDKIISFDISSDFGMFKKPDVNTPAYFTFNIIPKTQILGILGAVIGLGGYSQMKESDNYPEFYRELQDLLIGIVPYGNKGVYQKRLIKYNNTVGYANKDGGTLNIIEQTLIEPKYKIYIGLDLSKESHQKLNEFLDEKVVQYEYIPYMGKNEFKLDIDEVKHFEDIQEFTPNDEFAIFSLFPNIDNEALKKSEALRDPFDSSMSESYFYYFERLPIELDKLNQYQYENFAYTNAKMISNSEFVKKLTLFLIDEKIICLY
ncbi:CRISPR-associated protein, Cas5h family [hydrothermal vent metagenome]|uniref:CRISPR-associated protein, Cas5h family n=1 Tax=hydrothermal vent metagenome TaxID=652676 RepID=A0A1W1BBZ1_9ZZZZ